MIFFDIIGYSWISWISFDVLHFIVFSCIFLHFLVAVGLGGWGLGAEGAWSTEETGPEMRRLICSFRISRVSVKQRASNAKATLRQVIFLDDVVPERDSLKSLNRRLEALI